jgi:hypothetical protein
MSNPERMRMLDVDSEFVAVGAETQARLTDLGVMPKPGGEGEQAKPD